MYTPNDDLELLHPKLIALIEHEKRLCGCVMQAVRRVASKVGTSEHWVRRITGRYGKVKVQLHQGLNVMRAYVGMKRQQIREKRAAKRAARILSAENFPVA